MDIHIDQSKCVAPETCGRCLKVCSPQIFALHPEAEDVVQPRRWVIDPLWISLCIYCHKCVEECPHNAIQISK